MEDALRSVQLLEVLQCACSELPANTVGRLNTPSVYVEINLISVRVEVAGNVSPTQASSEELRVAQKTRRHFEGIYAKSACTVLLAS
jgi:hypothetical protein